MKWRKQRPIRLAAAQSEYEHVQGIESDARKLYFLQKVLRQDGEAAVISALQALTPSEYDPSSASVSATVSVDLISSQLASFEGSQNARRAGGTTRGRDRASAAARDYERIRTLRTELLAAHKEEREISGIIKARTGFSRNKIARAFAIPPSGNWKKGSRKLSTRD